MIGTGRKLKTRSISKHILRRLSSAGSGAQASTVLPALNGGKTTATPLTPMQLLRFLSRYTHSDVTPSRVGWP